MGLILMWIMTRLPYRSALRLGTQLGRWARHLAYARRHVVQVNLRLCFPELDAAARARLLADHFAALGMGLVETAYAWWGGVKHLQRRAAIAGLEHLHAAHARGRGVILLSAHFTTLEIAGRLLALQAPFHVVYREHKNPLFEAVMRRARTRHFERAIKRDDIRAIRQSLKQGAAVWFAPDQNFGGPQSLYVPFFGVPAATITTTARLARLSGAAVVPFFACRCDDGRYGLRLLPALSDFPSGDDPHDARRINRLVEQAIRACPEQYLWVHRRFKTHPQGKNYLYRR